MDIIAMAIAKALAKEYTDSRIIDIQSGGTGGISYYICSSSEYNSSMVPTVSNPDTNTIYITPTADGANGMFNLYNYKAHAWNLIKSVELEVSAVQVDNTLTVQGKAADAKKVGDELATVKDALSDLSVETDKTLSVEDKPADAKAVGDKINKVSGDFDSLYASFSLSGWSQGAFNRSNGANLDTPNVIRINSYIPEGTYKITCNSSYKMCIWAWGKSDNSFKGHLQPGNTFGTTTNYLFVTDYILDWSSGNKYKITFYNDDNSTAITPDKGVNCLFMNITDTTLTEAGKIADAQAVGEKFTSVDNAISESSNRVFLKSNTIGFAQGGFNTTNGAEISSSKTIRSVGFLSEKIIKAYCNTDYKFSIWAWNKNDDSFAGHIQEDGTYGYTSSYKFFTDYYFDHETYYYKICLYKVDNTNNILPSESNNIVFCFDIISSVISGIFAPVSEVKWAQGAFDRSNGNPISSDYKIRTPNYLTDSIVRITCDSNYHLIIYAWNKDTGAYVGHLESDESFNTTTSYAYKKDYYIDRSLNYKYKVVLSKSDNSAILPSDGVNCSLFSIVPGDLESNYMEIADKPSFFGSPITIFENDDEYVISGVDDGLLNFVNVVKVSDEMYYMYYESFSTNDGTWNYNKLRLCFAYSTDGEHFTKGFPNGVTAPIEGTNMIVPIGSTHGQCVVKVPDDNYPFRMVCTRGTNTDRVAQLWKSSDGITDWTLVRTITNGYNDSQAAVVVRGNYLKIFLRTRDPQTGVREIGIIVTDFDGNRLLSRWTNVISTKDSTKQLYVAAASAIDDRREILLPTVYNSSDSTEYVGCFIVDGDKSHYRELDMTAIMPSDVKSIYFGPGLVDIGLKTYAFYETRDSDHENFVAGTTKSAIRRVEVLDSTFTDVVRG